MAAPRVVHVLEAVSAGCARHLEDLVLSTPGVEHTVVCPRERRGDVTDTGAIETIRAAGVPVHHVDMRRSATSGRNPLAVAAVVRLARRARADVLHGHSSIGGVVARLAGTALRRPRVYTPNGIAPGRLAEVTERAMGRLTDRFVAVSPSEQALVTDLGLVAADRIRMIPNGIATDPPAPRSLRAMLDLPAARPIVGFVGRLIAQKAPEVLVDAATILAATRPDTTFVMIGDGPLAADVRARAAASPADIRLLSHLDEASAYLTDVDVLALPSRYEGAPYVPLEAMRAGVPVVLTDVTGSRDLVTSGVTGELVPPEDPPALAAAIAGLLADPGRRARIGAAGHDLFVQRYSRVAMGAAHAELYHDVVRR